MNLLVCQMNLISAVRILLITENRDIQLLNCLNAGRIWANTPQIADYADFKIFVLRNRFGIWAVFWRIEWLWCFECVNCRLNAGRLWGFCWGVSSSTPKIRIGKYLSQETNGFLCYKKTTRDRQFPMVQGIPTTG